MRTIHRRLLGTTLCLAACTAPAAADDGQHGHDDSRTAIPVALPATAIGFDRATLRGGVYGPGVRYSYHFEYGPTAALGSSTPESPSLVGGSQGEQASADVNGLAPQTHYQYRLVAHCDMCGAGGRASNEQTLTTQAAPPPPSGGGSGGGGSSALSTGSGSGSSATSGSSGSGAAGGSRGSSAQAGSSAAGTNASRPPLVAGSKTLLTAQSGTVFVRLTPKGPLQTLSGAETVPLGALVDATRGVVNLTVPAGAGRTQSATLWGGAFEAHQSHGGAGFTDLVLRGDLGCPTGVLRAARIARVRSASRRSTSRALWATDHHGRFRTYGHNSVATVRGTTWETVDRCDGTLTLVQSGTVGVRPRGSRREVLVNAGHSYLARAGR